MLINFWHFQATNCNVDDTRGMSEVRNVRTVAALNLTAVVSRFCGVFWYLPVYQWSIQISTRIYQNELKPICGWIMLDHVGSISVNINENCWGDWGAMDHTGPQFSDGCDGGCHPSTFTMPAHHDCSSRSSTSEVPLAGSTPTAPSQTWHVAFGSPIITYRMIWCLVFAPKKWFLKSRKIVAGLLEIVSTSLVHWIPLVRSGFCCKHFVNQNEAGRNAKLQAWQRTGWPRLPGWNRSSWQWPRAWVWNSCPAPNALKQRPSNIHVRPQCGLWQPGVFSTVFWGETRVPLDIVLCG